MCPYKTWGTMAQVEARREDDRARREWAALEFAERREILGLVNEMIGKKGSQVEVVPVPDSVKGMLKKLEGEKEARRTGSGKGAREGKAEGPREEGRRTRSSGKAKVVDPEPSISAPTSSRPTKKRKITSRPVIESQDDDDSDDDVVVVVPKSRREAVAGPSRAARGRRPTSPPTPLFLEGPSRTTPLHDQEIAEEWREEFEALMRKERMVEAQEEWARLAREDLEIDKATIRETMALTEGKGKGRARK